MLKFLSNMIDKIGKHRIYQKVLIIGLAFCVLSMVISCSNRKEITAEESNEIIDQLQTKMPFTIILPTYIPDGVITYPDSFGIPDFTKDSNNNLGVSLGYHSLYNDNNSMLIVENYYEEQVTHYASRSDSMYLDVFGITVLEESTEIPIGETRLRGYFYGWYRDDTDFRVYIYGFPRDECRKVIQSMIIQTDS